MPDQISVIKVSMGLRLLLLAFAALTGIGAWYAARVLIGDTIAQFPPDVQAAQEAVRLAPGDPRTHYTLGVLESEDVLPEGPLSAIQEYEQATKLDPNDYRLWLELGLALEQASDREGSERALVQATKLAPAYAYPRWMLGNLLLREGKQDAGFAELRQAANADNSLRPQIFNLASSLYHGDLKAVIGQLGDSAPARGQLVEYLVSQRRLDDALKLWNTLDSAQKSDQRQPGEKLMHALADSKKFHFLLEQYDELAPEGVSQISVGELLNGGFEGNIQPPGKSFFDWQITPATLAQIGVDTRHYHSGTRSLRIFFNAPGSFDFNNISQLIVVDPLKRYRLSYYVSTEDLKTGNTLITRVVDANDPNRALAESPPVPSGTNDWHLVTLDFLTTAQTEGIIVRLARAPCIASTCPIFGRIWYDDFDLESTGNYSTRSGGAGARANSPATSR